MYTLHSWGTIFNSKGLFSFDPCCLSIQTYLQLSKAEWQLNYTRNTEVSPNGCLPALVYDDTAVESGIWRILQFLKNEGHDLNAGLDEEQIAQSNAYISMIQGTLTDALLFHWYLVPENFTGVIRPQLARLFGFPFSMFIPTQLSEYAEQRLSARGVKLVETNVDDSSGGDLGSKFSRISMLARQGFKRQEKKAATHAIYKQINEHLAVLSNKLDQKKYFFGDNPTTLDAIAYGYLSLMLYPDLPQDTLKTLLKNQYPSLVGFCDRIHAQVGKEESLPVVVQNQGLLSGIGSLAKHTIYSYLPTTTTAASSNVADSNNDPQRTAKVQSVVGGLFVFFGYIIYNGILSAPASKPAAKTPSEYPKKMESSEVLSVLQARNIFK